MLDYHHKFHKGEFHDPLDLSWENQLLLDHTQLRFHASGDKILGPDRDTFSLNEGQKGAPGMRYGLHI
jgi:hypothetical protein